MIEALGSTVPSSHRTSDEETLVMKLIRIFSALIFLSLLTVLSGCVVKETSGKDDNGDKASQSKGAEITTPFGTLRARNEDNGKATGLAIYPGARLLKEKDN